jgi:hypothetical protein
VEYPKRNQDTGDRMQKRKTKHTNVSSGCEKGKETKVKSACYALYITTSVADVLELETTVLHVPDPTVGCICTATMVAVPLFPIEIYML